MPLWKQLALVGIVAAFFPVCALIYTPFNSLYLWLGASTYAAQPLAIESSMFTTIAITVVAICRLNP
jgi:hypothetical protein